MVLVLEYDAVSVLNAYTPTTTPESVYAMWDTKAMDRIVLVCTYKTCHSVGQLFFTLVVLDTLLNFFGRFSYLIKIKVLFVITLSLDKHRASEIS